MSSIPQEQSTNTQQLVEIASTILPYIHKRNIDLDKKTEENSEDILNQYYLFQIVEVSVPNQISSSIQFINEKFQNVLIAAYKAGIEVATFFKSEQGKLYVYLGFKHINGIDVKGISLAIIKGSFPGSNMNLEILNQAKNTSEVIGKRKYGGIVTGVPSLKDEQKEQFFNVASVIRSMYGEDYVLAIFSKPIPSEELQKRLGTLTNIQDTCHSLAKQTLSKQESTGRNLTEQESKAESSGISLGVSAFVFFGVAGGGINLGYNENTTESTGKSTTISESIIQGMTYESQNSLAIMLEGMAKDLVDRTLQGLNVGFWETSITFSTNSKTTADILGGSFTAELSKPSKLLYPAQNFNGEIEGEKRQLFLPKGDSNNTLFPKSLANYLTSTELKQIASLPTESLPGFEVKRIPALALTDTVYNNPSDIALNLGGIADHGVEIQGSNMLLSKQDINKHIFVCGITGSGKTTTVQHILKSSFSKSIPFLVLESAKREYRQLLGDEQLAKRLRVFTLGNSSISPIYLNPFYIQPSVEIITHIDHLKSIFNASFSLYGPMPHILEKCLHNVYQQKGWNLQRGSHPYFLDENQELDAEKYQTQEHYYYFPTLNDLKKEVKNYIENTLEYQGELKENIKAALITRIESLCVGAKGLMFNTHNFYPIDQLLDNPTIIEMESLADDDDKAFFVGLMLTLISEYRQRNNPSVNLNATRGLKNILVIEEAHRLLKNVSTERTSEMMGNPKGKAVEYFCNIIAEMRSLGQGVIVVEQIPTKISPDVIKNSNTKIVHRLVSKDDQIALAGSLSLDNKESAYLNRLKTGFALCHKEGMEKPVEIKINSTIKTGPMEHSTVKRRMQNLSENDPQTYRVLHTAETYELESVLLIEGEKIVTQFFNSLCIIKSFDYTNLINVLIEELENLLEEKRYKIKFTPKDFTGYSTKIILELLTNSFYAHSYNMPEKMRETLEKFFELPSDSTYTQLMEKLAQFWEVQIPQSFIAKMLKKEDIFRKEKANLENITPYFLIKTDDILNEINK